MQIFCGSLSNDWSISDTRWLTTLLWWKFCSNLLVHWWIWLGGLNLWII